MLTLPTAVSAIARPTAGVWDMLNVQFASAEDAIFKGACIAGAVIVLGTAYKTKAVMATLISAVIAAVMIFLVGGGLLLFSNKVGETVEEPAAQAVVNQGPAHGISVIPDDRV